MWIIIDDKRDLNCDIIARNAKAGKEVLRRFVGQIECLCLDHDMGERELTGYDVAKWAIDEGFLPNKVQLVTSNPVGRENIANLLIANDYKRLDYSNFEREV